DNSGSCLKDHHYQRRVARYQPQVVIILIGCNDIVTTPIPTVKSNITQFVQRLRGDGIIPVLQTYNTIKYIGNPESDYIRRIMIRFSKFDEFNDALRQIAAEQDIILVDNYKHWKHYTAEPAIMDFWSDDPLHPSARGHLEIANEILRTFGMYDMKSKCCSAVAGGPNPPDVEAALRKLEKAK
ncbi:MAG: SGNH/GDSL hydrolase family protein, partial [Victivallales bacterium]|nr:SGNH/GDSL hydrolase family protein [Victivallales bacterium]